eukprot:XP_001689616.1 predicted protein [Chlamydomonas reinhardtii]
MLGPDIIRNIAKELHPNDVACRLRLLNHATAEALRDMRTTIQLEVWPGEVFVAHWGRPDPWRALSLARRRRLLYLAASSHHAGSLEAALAHCNVKLKFDVFESAAAAGDLEACKRIKQLAKSRFPGRELQNAAAYCGQVAVLEYRYGHGELLERLLRRQESDVDIYAGARSAFFQAQFATHRVLELAALHCPAPTLRRLFVDWVPSGLVKWPTRCSLGWLVARAIVSPRADWEEKADFLAAQLQGAVPAEGFELTAEDEVTSQWIGTAIWNDKAGWGAVTQPELGKRHARLVGLAAYGVRPSNWHEELAQVLAISGNASALRELLDVWVQPVGSTWKSTVPGHAACSGHVPTMELLRERLGSHAFKLDDALAAARLFYGTAGLRYLAELKGLSAADTPRRGTAVTWNAVFSEAARLSHPHLSRQYSSHQLHKVTVHKKEVGPAT